MTAVLAGLVGGLLALSGAVVVQYLTARAARRDRIAKLGSQLLVTGAFMMEDLSVWMFVHGGNPPERASADVRFMPEAIAAASELSLLGGKKLALQAQVVSGAMNHLTLLAVPETSQEEWTTAVIDYGAVRLELMHRIREEIGRGRLSDDELGHDPPDIASPGSTHTPER